VEPKRHRRERPGSEISFDIFLGYSLILRIRCLYGEGDAKAEAGKGES